MELLWYLPVIDVGIYIRKFQILEVTTKILAKCSNYLIEFFYPQLGRQDLGERSVVGNVNNVNVAQESG